MREQRRKLLEELSTLLLLIRGSFFQRYSTCSRPTCACHKGKRHGPRSYVSVTDSKAQRQHFVPKSQVGAVQRGIRQYHRLLKITIRITRINLELMRRKGLTKKGP